MWCLLFEPFRSKDVSEVDSESDVHFLLHDDERGVY